MPKRVFVDNPTAENRRILNGLLDGFRLLGPLESIVWLADYFNDHALTMLKSGHAHGDMAQRELDLVSELRMLVAKYKNNGWLP